MDAMKIAPLREALLARQAELQTELTSMDAEMRSLGSEQELERGGLGNHLAEDGSSVTEQDRILAVGGDLRDLLVQTEEALTRMDDGTFGACLRCGKPIGTERLEAFPYVRHCIDCQTLIEREQSLRAGR